MNGTLNGFLINGTAAPAWVIRAAVLTATAGAVILGSAPLRTTHAAAHGDASIIVNLGAISDLLASAHGMAACVAGGSSLETGGIVAAVERRSFSTATASANYLPTGIVRSLFPRVVATAGLTGSAHPSRTGYVQARGRLRAMGEPVACIRRVLPQGAAQARSVAVTSHGALHHHGQAMGQAAQSTAVAAHGGLYHQGQATGQAAQGTAVAPHGTLHPYARATPPPARSTAIFTLGTRSTPGQAAGTVVVASNVRAAVETPGQVVATSGLSSAKRASAVLHSDPPAPAERVITPGQNARVLFLAAEDRLMRVAA